MIPSHAPSIQSEDSSEEEEDFMALSGDKGMAPDPSPFTGLFCPDLFRSLLHKAKAITKLGSDPVTATAPKAQDSGCMLFLEATTEQEVSPLPKLFLE